MPEVVQYITLVDPLGCFPVVLRGVFLEGTPFHLLIPLGIADWLFRHRMELTSHSAL